MGNAEGLTVAEFADLAGVSRQSVYKKLNKLNNPLNQYVNEVDSIKYIDVSALKDLYGIDAVEQPCQQNCQPSDNKVDGALPILNAAVESLREQLKEKDRQLAEKDKQIAEKDRQISEHLRLQDQQQQLLFREQGKALPPPKRKWFWQKREGI